MLQLGKCAKDNSKIFLLNRKVSKLSFSIKFYWNFLDHSYKSQNFKFKIQQKTFNKKDFVIHEKSPLINVKNEKKKHVISYNINKSLIIWVFLHFYPSKCDFWWK